MLVIIYGFCYKVGTIVTDVNSIMNINRWFVLYWFLGKY